MKGSTYAAALCVIGTLVLYGPARGSRATGNIGGTSAAAAKKIGASSSHLIPKRATLPLHFEMNRGQHAPEVQFATRGPGYGLFLTASEAVLVMASPDSSPDVQPRGDSRPAAIVRMSFAGAARTPAVTGRDALPGKANYLRGRNPSGWHTNVPTYARVAYRELYPGVDLIFHGDQQQLEYDFIVAPRTDPRVIQLSFAGVADVEVTSAGDLRLRTAAGEVRQQKPVIYQQAGDSRRIVEGGYVRRGAHRVGFELGPYDETKPLVIDPVLEFSSYLGGTLTEIGNGIAVDALGSAYLVGFTSSINFPDTTGPGFSGFEDVFVAKLTPDGQALVYATYLGGTGSDRGEDIAIDAAGHAYVTGSTNSADFPVVNALQPTIGSVSNDAFVARLNEDGTALVFATYLGGNAGDDGRGIAVDEDGNAYVVGATMSPNFPVLNAFQPALAGTTQIRDAFVSKLNPAGSALVYSTFLGGSGLDDAAAVAVNADGHAFVTGSTTSADFPAVNPFQPTGQIATDAFVTQFSDDGSELVYSSKLGGSVADLARDIAVDTSNRATVVGVTASTDFPVVQPLFATISGVSDAFVTTVDESGTSLFFSSYLGGSSFDDAMSVAVDANGDPYIAGLTLSSDFPVFNPLLQLARGGTEAFIAKIDMRVPFIAYATYLGGEAEDMVGGVAVDAAGSVYFIGSTMSNFFPVVNALQPQRASQFQRDAVFAKISNLDVCAQDEQTGHTLNFNSSTGGYQFTACGTSNTTLMGTGEITHIRSRIFLIDKLVAVRYDNATGTVFATIAVSGSQAFTIKDASATFNIVSTCTCP
jgi:hypothetical protein